MEYGILAREENVIAILKLLSSMKVPWECVFEFSEIKSEFNKGGQDYQKALNVILYKYGRLQEKNELQDTETKDADGNTYVAKLRRLTTEQTESKDIEIQELNCKNIDLEFPIVDLEIFRNIYEADQAEIKEFEEFNKKARKEDKEEKEIDMSKYMTGNDMTCYILLGIAVKNADENKD